MHKKEILQCKQIENHLSHYIELGEASIDEFVSKEKQQMVIDAYTENKESNLSQLKEMLPEISFSELKFVIAYILFTEQKK